MTTTDTPTPTLTITDHGSVDGWHTALVRIAGRDDQGYLWVWWE